MGSVGDDNVNPVSRRAPVAAVVLASVALAASTTAALVGQNTGQDPSSAFSVALLVDAIAVVGVVITLTVPGNLVGWLLTGSGAAIGTGGLLIEVGILGVATKPGSIPAAGYLPALGSAVQAAGLLTFVVAVPVVFPDGDRPTIRWRWVGRCAAASVVAIFLGNLLNRDGNVQRLSTWSNPWAAIAGFDALSNVLSLAAVGLAVVTLTSAITRLVIRWRRGGPLVRQQLLLYAASAVPPALTLVVIVVVDGVPGWIIALAALPMAAAILVAIVAHHVYDLRRATHRAVLGMVMSLTVLGIYAGTVLAVAALMPGAAAWWPSAVAAVCAALALLPAHHRLQGLVTRLVYGRWREPYDVLAAIGRQLEAADVDRILESAVSELTAGLGLDNVSLRAPSGALVAGVTRTGGSSVALSAYGRPVGRLCFDSPQSLSGSEQQLLHDLGSQLGAAMHARAVRDDLQHARGALVLAREEERRRLRRDLHDGIGPALAGLTLKAVSARAVLPPDAAASSRQLESLAEEIRQTATEVRRVVEGLRPPALDELGLVGACSQIVQRLTAASALDVTIESDPLPPLPAAVEVAAYRILVEAVTNVVRHAEARRCAVTISHDATQLVLRVVDDGHSRPAGSPAGHGLDIMRERADELGGRTTVEAGPGASGTAVTTWIPLPGNQIRPNDAALPHEAGSR